MILSQILQYYNESIRIPRDCTLKIVCSQDPVNLDHVQYKIPKTKTG